MVDVKDRYICIHGHFYQPPRENPWTDVIDAEPSAAPWSNWNERITDECYAPNTGAEILGPEGEVVRRFNNYAAISFNVGPTLMAWMARARPMVHRAIVESDARSRARFGGHGGAIAQAHGHLILPLANERDRRTQVRWGIADFKYRFGRPPAGMWLPETAVDVPTLEALAAEGIAFTILAPHQAARVRAPGGAWRKVGGGVSPGRAYRQRLPSGRDIALFFYDGELARGVAFDGLLHDGAGFARGLEASAERGGAPRLAHLATDGESYGHHHRHGEMALAWALDSLEREARVRLTTYAAFLAAHPPTWDVEVAEDTSWSCAHGVRRWSGGCDCGTGGEGWDYGWRGPLRAALDGLRDRLASVFETEGSRQLRDPWSARDAWIEWRLPAGAGSRRAWEAEHLAPTGDRNAAMALLAMQDAAMRMFTSCGWFFDDPAGLETRQVLRYAARAVELAGEVSDGAPGREFAADLALIGSNREEGWTAAAEYERILREDRLPAAAGG
jgi:alpha-amylase/alpha-mannosidase (GH57 family)